MIDTKFTRIFNGFINLDLIEFNVLIVYLGTRCVSRRKDAYYIYIKQNSTKMTKIVPSRDLAYNITLS
jgi:hypothetical protein